MDNVLGAFLESLFNLKSFLIFRATMLFAVLQSLSSILPEYQFSLEDFLDLFDAAVPGDFPQLYAEQKSEVKVCPLIEFYYFFVLLDLLT